MTTSRTAFMFSGQGSQYFQMGEALYRQYPAFRSGMGTMDEIMRELSGYSVVELLYERGYTRSATFDRTLLSHPAILMVQYATAQLLIDAGVTPDLTIGTGVGTFAAAVIAGCLTVEDALLAMIRQASMLEACCQKGGMLAVLHDPATFAEDDALNGNSEIACINLPKHFVVSAQFEPLREIERALRARGTTLQRLPVPFAFHSRWIDAAQEPFDRFMRSIPHRTGHIPLMCPLRAQLLTQLPGDYLWRAVREPVQLYASIQELESQGSYRYIDVGPSGTLSNIVKHALGGTSQSTTRATLTPFGHDLKNVSEVIESGS